MQDSETNYYIEVKKNDILLKITFLLLPLFILIIDLLL